MYIAPSRFPETYWQLLMRSLKLYRKTLRHVFLLSLLLSLTVFIPRLISFQLGNDAFAEAPMVSWMRFWLTLLDVVSLLLFAAILWRMKSFIRDGHEPIIEDLKIGLKKVPAIVVAALFQVVLVTVLAYGLFFLVFHRVVPTSQVLAQADHLSVVLVFFLQFVVGCYLFVLFYFYLPIIVVEKKGILVSLEKSVVLVWRNGWRTFCFQMTPWLVYFAVLWLLKSVFHIPFHIYFLESEYSFSITLVNIVLFAFFQPWVASILLVQLRDLELRKKLTNSI